MSLALQQCDVRLVVLEALSNATASYWTAPAPVKSTLAAVETSLSQVLTKLNQSDIAARTEDFDTAAKIMKDQILPGIHKLDMQVATLVKVDESFKSTMSLLMKVSTTSPFFKIPVPF